jgi:toxin ParE1/3/4
MPPLSSSAENPHAAEMTSLGDIRAKTVPRYRFRLFYRVVEDDDAIEIVHVRHTSRRPWSGE